MLNIEIDIACYGCQGNTGTETTLVDFQGHRLQKSVVCNYSYLFAFETVGNFVSMQALFTKN